jgi:hypothetical protein
LNFYKISIGNVIKNWRFLIDVVHENILLVSIHHCIKPLIAPFQVSKQSKNQSQICLGLLPFSTLVNHLFLSPKVVIIFNAHCECSIASRRRNENSRAPVFPQRGVFRCVLLVTFIVIKFGGQVCAWLGRRDALPRWSTLATKNKRAAAQMPLAAATMADDTTMMTGTESVGGGGNGKRVTGQHCCARPGLVLRVAESTGAALEGGRAVALGYWQAGRGNWSREGHDLSKVGPSVVASGPLRSARGAARRRRRCSRQSRHPDERRPLTLARRIII